MRICDTAAPPGKGGKGEPSTKGLVVGHANGYIAVWTIPTDDTNLRAEDAFTLVFACRPSQRPCLALGPCCGFWFARPRCPVG